MAIEREIPVVDKMPILRKLLPGKNVFKTLLKKGCQKFFCKNAGC
jgi:hypothetical protein